MGLYNPSCDSGGGGPLDCATDSVTICPGDDPIVVEILGVTPVSGSFPVTFSSTIELGPTTLAALETITVNQGTSPWVVSGTVNVGTISGTLDLGATTLAALETINIGNIPHVIVDSGTIALDAGTLAALETITVLQGTSPWVIGDGGGSITVDGTITADTNFDYPEDSVHVSGNPGAFVLAVRNDAGTPLAGDGDYIPFTTDSSGALRVTGGGSSVTQTGRDDTDNQTAVATGLLTSVDRNYVWDSVGGNWDRWTGSVSVSGTVTTALDAATLAALESITVQNPGGASAVNIQDGGNSITVDGTVTVNQGTSPWVTSLDATTLAALESITVQNGSGAAAVNIQDGGNSITVDGSVTVSGTVATNSERAEDSAHSSGQIGNFVLGVRNDTAAVRTDNDGDYSPISTDSAGRVGISDLGGAISVDDNGGSLTVDGTVSVSSISGTLAVTQSTSPWIVEQADVTTVTAPAQTSIGTTAATTLTASAGRRGWMIQNTGLTTIKIALGSTNPTQTAYHIALYASSSADDGTGGVYMDDQWTGDVRIISSASGGTCVVTSLS